MLTGDGLATEAVPPAMQDQPALTDAQIHAVAELALALERSLGWPVDIECALVGEQWHLLQCRPITALPVQEDGLAEDKLWAVTWTRPEDAT